VEQAQYWLFLKIAKHPRIFSFGAGLAIAGLLMAATIASILITDKANTAERHERASQLANDLMSESISLLDHLQAHNDTSCDMPSITHLNADMLHYHYIREVGVLDAEGRLICTSSMGRLPQPVKHGLPPLPGPAGMEIYTNVPLQVLQEAGTATIVQRGRFNAALSARAVSELLEGADLIWLPSNGKLTVLDHGLMERNIRKEWRKAAENAGAGGWALRRAGYELISVEPEFGWVLQTRRSWMQVADQYRLLLIPLLAGSVLFAFLAMAALAPAVRQLRSVQRRLRFLCQETHIVLSYQPIFQLSPRRVIGCETLMQMQEENEVWCPDQVIPGILSRGLARRFDHAVARKAIRELTTHLPPQTEKFRLAVNFFPESIDRATLSPVLDKALSEAGRSDIQLCLEITEYSASADLAADIQYLRRRGYLISVDDFGTGYSNLKSVARLSPDYLKMEKSFAMELDASNMRGSLIKEIVAIAQTVGAEVVAEGVENEEQARLLHGMGVRYGQGYGLGRPLPLLEFLDFLQTSQAGSARPASSGPANEV